jgi:uncharacterized protein
MSAGRVVAEVLWRRLDAPGHDACRLLEAMWGWQLEGGAVFNEAGAAVCLRYEVACDANWGSQRAVVSGWSGARAIDVRVEQHAGGGWSLNGVEQPQLKGCADFDIGFSPATNTLSLRRLNLREGQAADVPVAWFDLSQGALSVLSQRYRRIARDRYEYTAPSVPYAAVLEVTPLGLVARYPGLWEIEPA